MHVSLSTLGACGIIILVVVILGLADAAMVDDAEFSPLYEATLQQALDRFEETDRRVPAGRAEVPPDDPVFDAALPVGPAGGTAPPGAPPVAAPPAVHSHDGPEIVEADRLYSRGQYEEAIAGYRVHLAQHPGCSLIHHRVGDVLRAMGRGNEAIAEYRETLRHRESYSCAHEHIGDILAQQGKPAESEAAYAAAVAGYRSQIDQAGPVGAGGRYQLAKFYVAHDRNLEEAVALAESVSGGDPDNVAYLLTLATAYEKTSRYTEAIATVDRILQLRPDLATAYAGMRARIVERAAQETGGDE